VGASKVLRGIAAHARHVFYWLVHHGCGKPIKEAHAVGLPRVEPAQYMGASAVIQGIFASTASPYPPMMAWSCPQLV